MILQNSYEFRGQGERRRKLVMKMERIDIGGKRGRKLNKKM